MAQTQGAALEGQLPIGLHLRCCSRYYYTCLLYTSYEDFCRHRKEYGYITRMGSHVFFNGMALGETNKINIEDGKTLVIKYLGLGDHNEMCIRDRSWDAPLRQPGGGPHRL